MVPVPEMAESISEGTLKQFSKSVGDHVEQDEEIATIETDKIDVAVNAPEAGVVKEFLVKEEDTVTVGQEIVKLDAGAAAPEGGASQESQRPEQGKETKQQPQQKASESGQLEQEKPKPPPQQGSKPQKESEQGKEQTPPPPPPRSKEQPRDEPKQSESKGADKTSSGNREERRVCLQCFVAHDDL